MSIVTEHLEQRGDAFEALAHRQAYTSIGEARALGIDADEVLKTLAVHTGPGYVLMVIPAARRLDLHLVREALGDNHARLATEKGQDADPGAVRDRGDHDRDAGQAAGARQRRPGRVGRWGRPSSICHDSLEHGLGACCR
jgi:Aminoacyl-tRNA editing domain